MHSKAENDRLDASITTTLERSWQEREEHPGREMEESWEPVARAKNQGDRYWIISALNDMAHKLGYYTLNMAPAELPGWIYVRVVGKRPKSEVDVERAAFVELLLEGV